MAVGEKPSAKQGWRGTGWGAGTVLSVVGLEDFRLASTRSTYRFWKSRGMGQETLEGARACPGKRGRWLGQGDGMEERGVGPDLGVRVGEQGWLQGWVCAMGRGGRFPGWSLVRRGWAGAGGSGVQRWPRQMRGKCSSTCELQAGSWLYQPSGRNAGVTGARW